MSRIKTKTRAKKIVKKYAQKLREAGYLYSAIYLFGSHAQNKARRWSDIDVAVISDKLKENWEENENMLWYIRRKVDSMIEPIGFTVKEFQDNCDPMVYEIKKTGIRIV